MVVVSNIIGGFGNQLFQYAMGYSVAKDRQDEYYIDISQFKFDKRKFVLDNLDISAKILDVEPAKNNSKICKGIARFNRLKKTGLFTTNYIQEDKNNLWTYAYPDLQKKNNLYLNGYWQSYKYFDHHRQEIMEELIPKSYVIRKTSLELIGKVSKVNSVAIHIRRGDYVDTEGWLISEKYFLSAVDFLNKKLENLKLFVFCEDYEFAKKIFDGKYDMELITDSNTINDLEEFYIMSACKHQIISNSSYSWWAAYLNKNPNKLVVAPKFKQWGEDFYLPEWILLDA